MQELTELFTFLEKNQSLSSAAAAMTSAVVAVLALIVSIAAVIATVRSAKQQKNHNILTVKPIPEVTVADYEDSLRIKLRNHGSGPLLIKSLTAKFQDKSHDALIDCMPNISDINWTNFAGNINGRALLPGAEIILVELTASPGDIDFRTHRDLTRLALSHSEVTIDYSDIYNTKFPTYRKSLEWFRRNLE
ncbi:MULTISPECIES: hypothetical protein [Pseudomonas]|uniref:Uncharacterized protein n=1 Tax=Pseudomonas kurunegalensis TaxID=485880 RepID=A0ACC5UP23_9PSED|nr:MULTISPECIES: hypothetical protein [Pseudomonas]MBV4516174.1 hypothetical protein [Pseudomonas kurunegalensis]